METADKIGSVIHPSCWISMDENPDDSGKLPVRNCSCRGTDAGFAHLSCLVECAKGKTKQCGSQFTVPWSTCPRCMQLYQGKLALDLADEYILFAKTDHPGDNTRIVVALSNRLFLLSSISNQSVSKRLQPDHIQKAKETADELFSLLGDIKSSRPSLPPIIYQFEANAYNRLGLINSSSGTKEGAKAALECYEKCLAIAKGRGFADCIEAAEYNIAGIKSKYGMDSPMTNEQLLMISQKRYAYAVERHGESGPFTIAAGKNLAIALMNAHQNVEAKRLLKKLLALSKLVHGEEHGLTKGVASTIKLCYFLSIFEVLLRGSAALSVVWIAFALFKGARWIAFALFNVLQ